MRTASLFVLVTVRAFATPETVLQADRVADLLVLNQVYLNGQGPFRMMIDTGNGSSIVCRDAAKRLGLRPIYAVQVDTSAGEETVAATILDDVRVGPLRDGGVEAMLMESKVAGIDGVLGQSWLMRHDYMLDYRRRWLVMDVAASPVGIRTALSFTDGRPQVSAEVDGHRQDLIVDSGTSVLVLFGQVPSTRGATLVTHAGSVDARIGSVQVTIGGHYRRRLTTAEVATVSQPGLLPAARFKSVYISKRDGVVVFVP